MKDEREDFNLDPEASWGKAEQLLDRHFRRKRWGLALLILLIAGVTTLVTVQLLDSQVAVQQRKDVLQPVAAETLPAQSPETNTQQSTVTQSVEGRLKQPAPGSITAMVPLSSIAMSPEARPSAAHPKRSKPEITRAPTVFATTGSDEQPILAAQKEDLAGKVSSETTFRTDSGALIVTASDKRQYEPMAFLSTLHRVFELPGQPVMQDRQVFTSQPRQELSWHITATAGIFQVFKQVESDWKSWDDIRNNREQEVMAGQYGLSLGVGGRSWDVTLGAELTQYGERNEYVPRSYQDQFIDDSHWQSYTYWSVDTDTAYVMGNPWMLHSDVQLTDSNWVASYDTLNELAYDPSIDAARARTSIRYIEVPLDFTWRVSRNRWGFGVSAGFAPAWLVASRGRYISRSLRGTEAMQDLGELRQVLFNARLGLEAEYRLHPSLTLLIRPQYRQQFSSIFKDNSGITQRYQAVGVLAGVRYRFR